MPATLIVGTQWGDEGKAKIIDFLSASTDIVVRYQGGANAGHTVKVEDKKYVFHLIPSGILYPNTICVLGGGMVLDPEAYLQEVTTLEAQGIQVRDRLRIADNAHLLLPYHKEIDSKIEDLLAEQKIGTTKRGIGMCYVDKVNRMGIRIGDLLSESFFKERFSSIIKRKNKELTGVYGLSPIKEKELAEYLRSIREKVCENIINSSWYLNMELAAGKQVLLEGAQGSMLDLDFGTYPYVTSSNPTTGGALTGTGISFQHLKDVIGIAKAYTTRVGAGPFPSELHGEQADQLRELGAEYGSTTGRPRRIGWFDAEVVRQAVRLNGLTSLALTKLDVLDTLETIPVVVGYMFRGRRLAYFPSFSHNAIEPIYETLPGWKEPTKNCTKFRDLPKNARKYVQTLEKLCGVPIKWVSVGPTRKQTIKIK